MLSYPTHFLKMGRYLFWINFLANRIWQSKPLARRNVFYLLFSTNKTKPAFLLSFVVVVATHLL